MSKTSVYRETENPEENSYDEGAPLTNNYGTGDETVAINQITGDADLPNQNLNFYLLFMCIILSLGSLQFGYAIGSPNSPKLAITQCDLTGNSDFFKPCIPMTSFQWSVAVAIFTVGGLISSLVAGKISDFVGRKWFLVANNLLFFASFAMMSLSSNFYVFTAGRFVLGLGAGIVSVVVPMYLGEISPTKVRGALGSLHQLQVTIGILVAQLLGIPLSTQNFGGWRILFAIPVVFVALQVIVLPFFPESPRWLVSRKKAAAAESALIQLRRSTNIQQELSSIIAAANKDSKAEARFTDLFRKSLIKPMIIGIGLQLAQQLSGVNVVFFFSTSIFQNAGVHNANIATAIVGLINVGVTILTFFVIDRAGRRILLLIGEAGCFMFFLGLTLSFIFKHLAPSILNYVSVVCVIGFVIFFAFSIGPIPWLILAELFPADVRGFAVSIAAGVNWTANCVIAISFESLQQALQQYTFIPYTVVIAVSFVFTLVLVPETKGKSIEELTGDA